MDTQEIIPGGDADREIRKIKAIWSKWSMLFAIGER